MNNQQYFTDTITATLSYVESETVDVTDTITPSEAKTVTLDTQWNQFFDTDEYVTFDATVAQPIVQPYFYDGEQQQFKKSEQELRDAQAQIDNLPWTVDHPENKRITDSTQIRGFWSDPTYDDGQHATLYIPATDSDAVRYAIENDNVSIGFGGELDWVDESTYQYDAVQRNIAYDHIASVPTGRCAPEDGCALHVDADTDTEPTSRVHGHVVDRNINIVADATRTVQTTTELTEGMEDDMNPTHEEGEWVRWDWAGGTAEGQITAVSTSETLQSSGATRDPTEEGKPAYKIESWANGSFGNMVVRYEGERNLRSIDPPESFTDGYQVIDHGVGDWVTWQNGDAHGKIVEIVREGCTTRGKGDTEVCAESDDPAVVVEVYDDETGESQDEEVRHKHSTLNSWNGPTTDGVHYNKTDSMHYDNMPMSNDEMDQYDTKSEAEARATEIGCSGAHSHEGMDGEMLYMPCESMSSYQSMVDMEMQGDYQHHGNYPMSDAYNCGCSDGPCNCGLHVLGDAEINGEEIDLTVPDGAQSAAELYLEANEMGLIPSSCGTGSGTTSAEMIADGSVTAARLVSDIAPYLTSHEEDVSTDQHPSDWEMPDPDDMDDDEMPDTPWTDCGDAQYAAWGWMSMLEWAQNHADMIKQARGEEPVYTDTVTTDMLELPTFDEGDMVQHQYLDVRGVVAHNPDGPYVMVNPVVNGTETERTMTFGVNDLLMMDDGMKTMRMADESTIMDTITFDGLKGGDLDESEIPNEGYQPHYVFDAETKSESSYPLVDGDGNLRRGNVDAAWQLYGRAEDEQFLLDVLAQANKQFGNADGMSAPIPDDSLQEAMTDSQSNLNTTMTDASDFYDGEPDVETLQDDFTAVEALVDTNAELEHQVDELESQLHEYRRTEFTDKATELAEILDSRDVDTLVEKFEDGEMTIEDVEQQLTVAQEAIGAQPTTIDTTDTDETPDSESTLVADNTGGISDTDLAQRDDGSYDLRRQTQSGAE